MKKISLEIVVPIYHEGDKVIKLLDQFQNIIKTQIRVFLCYDTEKDSPRFFRICTCSFSVRTKHICTRACTSHKRY